MTDYFIEGTIRVTPAVTDRLAGTGFADDSDDSKDIRVVPPYDDPTRDFSLIESACPDGTGAPEDAVAHLRELVGMLGDDVTYDGSLEVVGDDDELFEQWRVRVVRRSADGAAPPRWEVVEEDAVVVYPADYDAPDGPAVRFDARAAYEWLTTRVDTTSPKVRANSYNIAPSAAYNRVDGDRPGDWLVRLLDLGNMPAEVWRVADAVKVTVIETLDAADVPDGSAMFVVRVGGLRLATERVEAYDFARDAWGFNGDEITQIEAVLQTLEHAAEVINRTVEQYRTIRAAGTT